MAGFNDQLSGGGSGPHRDNHDKHNDSSNNSSPNTQTNDSGQGNNYRYDRNNNSPGHSGDDSNQNSGGTNGYDGAQQGFGARLSQNLKANSVDDLKHLRVPGKSTAIKSGKQAFNKEDTADKNKQSKSGPNLEDAAKKAHKVSKTARRTAKATEIGAKTYGVARVLETIKMLFAGAVTRILDSPLASIAIAAMNLVKGAVAGTVSFVKGVAGGIGTGIAHAGAALGSLVGVSAKAGTLIVASATIAASGGGTVALTTGILPFLYSDTGDTCTTNVNKDSADTSTALKGDAGDWTKKGTTSYKNAKAIWDAWKKHGLSGAAIAGILGNIAHEGGFAIPDRAEGHMSNDEHSAGIAFGVVPDHPATYPEGGGGPYQLTGFSKFAPLNSKDWLDLQKQTDFAWKNEISKGLISWPYNVGGHGVGNFTTYAHLTDPAKAAAAWFSMYERGAAYVSAKGTDAKQAYTTFDGASVGVDDSLLGAGAGGNTTADKNTAAAGSAEAAKCDTSSDSDVADGTGSVKESSAQGVLHWAKDAVPTDVKQYIHDPADAGLAWGNATGWFNGTGGASNQCVGFASSYFYAIWSGMKQVMAQGGVDETNDWSKSNGGEKSNTPHAGAIASAPGGVSGVSSNGPFGHTWVVQHVLANGDIILAEQNMNGLSGEGNGTHNTWNFGWMSKSKYNKSGITFYTPKSPHKLTWSKSSK